MPRKNSLIINCKIMAMKLTGHQKIREFGSMAKLCILRLSDCRLRRIQAGLLLLIVVICSSIIIAFDPDGKSFSIRLYPSIR